MQSECRGRPRGEIASATWALGSAAPISLQSHSPHSPVSLCRALLARHSFLKSSLPSADPVAPDTAMAVAASITHLGDGNSGGSMVAVDGVTMLPAGSEWLHLVRGPARQTPISRPTSQPIPWTPCPYLAPCERVLPVAHRAGPALWRHRFERFRPRELPLRVAACGCRRDRTCAPTAGDGAVSFPHRESAEPLRAVAQRGDAATGRRRVPDLLSGAADAIGSLMRRPGFARRSGSDLTRTLARQAVHETTGQTPRLACPTCRNRFHASCLFTWFGRQQQQQQHEVGGAGGARRSCPFCRSDIP